MVNKILKKKKKPGKPGKPQKKKPIPAKVLKYLEESLVKYETIEHRTVYTAIDAAMTMKKKLSEIAKSLLIKAGKDYYIILLQADHNLDLKKLKKEIVKTRDKPVGEIKIPKEKELERALKVKLGTMTAFGKLHRVGVIVDIKLAKAKKAIFASGSQNYSIHMAVKDYIKQEEALLASFSIKKKIKKQKTTKPKKKK